MKQHYDCLVAEEEVGLRLDRYLAKDCGISRSRAAQRISAGDVTINGQIVNKPSRKVEVADAIHVVLPPPRLSTAIPEDIPLSIVYEDTHLCVVDKAADMVVHPAPGHDSGTLVNALLHRYGVLAPELASADGFPRPGIVHRLDRGTSGLLLVARSVQARDALQEAIAGRHVKRQYLAIVHGQKLEEEGTFDTLHGRHPRNRKRFSSRVKSGRQAITHYKVLARGRAVALVQCRLQTGRTHQIRVHFADCGHPLVGDLMYGGRRRAPGSEGAALRGLTRQALHAWKLELDHPVSGLPLRFETPPHPDMGAAIQSVFGLDPNTLEP